MALNWTSSLAVGVADIDQQHQELFGAVNRLLQAAAVAKGRGEIENTVDFLGEYVVRHFAAEEQLMTKRRYPNMAAHKAEHTQFVNEFALIKARVEAEGPTTHLVIVIQRRVCDWLVGHIGKTDKQLGQFLTAT